MKKKKILSFFLTLCLAVSPLLALPARALTDPAVESRAAIVLDRNSGEVFFSKNPDERVYPASTTKIMTVFLAVEAVEAGYAALSDEVTASANMSFDLEADGSTAGIQEGETMTLEHLLYCAMLASANEACNIIAEYIAGSVYAFVEQMNARAAELGCTGTHFANTHGLPNTNHYTTPSDFCRIAREAVSHDLFMQFCNTASIDIPATNLSDVRNLVNSNALITADSIYGSQYFNPDAAGVKTGHTNDAGYCLVSTASRDGIELLAVVFGGYAETNESGSVITGYTSFSDSNLLYDWVFNNFSYQEVLSTKENVASVDVDLSRDEDYVNLRPSASISLLLPNDYNPAEFQFEPQVYSLQRGEKVTAPVTAGEVLGEITVFRDGQSVGTVNLVAASSVDLSRTQYILSHIRETTHSTPFIVMLLIVILVLGAYIAWVIVYRVKYSRYRKAATVRRGAPAAQPRKHAAPSIEFFPDDETAPEDESYEEDYRAVLENIPFEETDTPPEIPGESVSAPGSDPLFQDQTEQDYFENFFRQK